MRFIQIILNYFSATGPKTTATSANFFQVGGVSLYDGYAATGERQVNIYNIVRPTVNDHAHSTSLSIDYNFSNIKHFIFSFAV
jgi:hypothetical protein